MLLFLYVCKQTFYISWVRISQKVNSYPARPWLFYFYVKTKILDFYICISVPLTLRVLKNDGILGKCQN